MLRRRRTKISILRCLPCCLRSDTVDRRPGYEKPEATGVPVRLSPLSVPANLLALPAVAPVLWLGVTAALLHEVWPPLAAPLLALADLLAGYLLWVAELCS